MKLEASPVGEISAGMVKIQSQLDNISLQIQDIKKGKDICEEIWCTRCKTEGHHKYLCPTFIDYLASGLSRLPFFWCSKSIKYIRGSMVQSLSNKRRPPRRIFVFVEDSEYTR